ncbi:MAG TPA: ribonuclease P protein component [Candidatus Paceibacterota bacterium]|nr:ribonuclease P protein component [Candidatus Paceibacterota bacterium]
MPKQQRLSRVDFSSITGPQTRRFHGVYFTLSARIRATDRNFDGPAFAPVISKKIAVRAVDRNRVRRLCREIFRKESKHVLGPRILVFYAKKAAVTASFQEIERDIKKLLSELPKLPTRPIAGYNARQ